MVQTLSAKIDTGNVPYNFQIHLYTWHYISTWDLDMADIQSLVLWNRVNRIGGQSTRVRVDAFEVNVTTSDSSNCSLNITTDSASVPDDTNHYLEINYSRRCFWYYGSMSGTALPGITGAAWMLLREHGINDIHWTPTNTAAGTFASGTWMKSGGPSRGNLSMTTSASTAIHPEFREVIIWMSGRTLQGTGCVNQKLQLMYNATGDNFTLQLYNGSSFLWIIKRLLTEFNDPGRMPLTNGLFALWSNFGP